MIETALDLEKRRVEERVAREERAKGYQDRMGVTLPIERTQDVTLQVCVVCEERKRKDRERVKRYREKSRAGFDTF